MLVGSLVTTAWRALRLRMEGTASRYGGWGRAIAQAVSRRLPTAAALVQTRVWSCEIL
jgi:hypothetical protein